MTPLVIIFLSGVRRGANGLSAAFAAGSIKTSIHWIGLFGRWLDRNERLFALPVRWVGAGRLLHLGRDWIYLGGVDRGNCFLGAAISPT